MAPIRRYLRITKRSVLEVRVYLDKPSDSPWLLSSRDPILPRIMEEIRPKVLPKLREENENAKKKSGRKKKGIKDVVSTEDFEVVIFLKELSTRHTLLTKQKQLDARKPRLQATGNKLTGWLNNRDSPVDLGEDEEQETFEPLRVEEDEVVELSNIPEVITRDKRKTPEHREDALFVSSDEEQDGRAQEGIRMARSISDNEREHDDKKKLALNTSYGGFSIYGRTLCLIVKRKGKHAALNRAAAPLGGSEMMEEWISTQAAQEAGLDENDEG